MIDDNIVTLTADIISAHVSNNSVPTDDLPALITSVYRALNDAGKPVVEIEEKREPAVSIRASVKADYIVCLEDGKKLKMLKRHLAARYSMTPEQYRVRWNLPADYPMVAPDYAAKRAELAKSIGLGRKPRTTAAKSAPIAATTPKAPNTTPAPAEGELI